VAAPKPVASSKAVPGEVPSSAPARQNVSVSGDKRPLLDRVQQEETADLEKTVSELNDYVQNMKRSLQFSVDDDTGRTIIKVIDPESKEVIRQIPREEILTIARMLREETRGALLEEHA
jgi:flagellar protein FlaG